MQFANYNKDYKISEELVIIYSEAIKMPPLWHRYRILEKPEERQDLLRYNRKLYKQQPLQLAGQMQCAIYSHKEVLLLQSDKMNKH